MIETADVVIIGGGIVGASVAYHLAEAGCAHIVIVEREARQGLGSTGRATGGARAQFGTDINIQMSRYSIEFLTRFADATGHASGYKPYGYLFLATSAAQFAQLQANRVRQIAQGLTNVELLTADDVRDMLPLVRADDIVGATFCPTDGYVQPLSIMRGFTARALAAGARLWLETEVKGIEVDGAGVAAVETTRGRIATRAVVNAAGAWAAPVARLAGVEIPVTPLRRQLVVAVVEEKLPQRLPMVIDAATGFHFRRAQPEDAANGLLMAWPDPAETAGFKQEFEPEFARKIRPYLAQRAPTLARAKVDLRRCRAGLYEMTPDHHAIIGEAPNVRGLFLANGFSGHGVMHSPATGRIISELILRGRSETFDITQLGAERFAAGRLLQETGYI